LIPGLRQEVYLDKEFNSLQDLASKVDFWDASTSSAYGKCPRSAFYKNELKLGQIEEALPRVAGRAVHAGMAVLYSSDRNADLALDALRAEFGDREAPDPGHKYAHLHLGHLEVIFKNYVDWSAKHDTFTPLTIHLDDINYDHLLGAIWLVTEDDRVVLGESKLIMRFELEGGRELVYSGRPDLPVNMSGGIYVLDHKSTSGYLSDWYFSQHVISNQLRGYCKMIEDLIDKRPDGALVNGIYVGDKATKVNSKAVRFSRYGPLVFRPAHLDEAIKNQYYWRQLSYIYRELDFWPQNTGKMCQSCDFLDLCKTSPRSRATVVRSRYVKDEETFLDY
jgi:hypothetical protein